MTLEIIVIGLALAWLAGLTWWLWRRKVSIDNALDHVWRRQDSIMKGITLEQTIRDAAYRQQWEASEALLEEMEAE